MDPLALLSDDEGEEAASSNEAEGAAAEEAAQSPAKKPKVTIDFEALQSAGYARGKSDEEERKEAEQSLKATFSALDALKPDEPDHLTKAVPKSVHLDQGEFGCEPPPDSIEVYDESGAPDLEPWSSFDSAVPGLGTEIVDVMRSAGFAHPTPIQAHTWPIVFSGRDLIGVAKTGSGKTLAFLLPCFATLMREMKADNAKKPKFSQAHNDTSLPAQMLKPAIAAGAYSPAILVIAPSRELVMQIETEAKKFNAITGMTTLALYGGGGQRGGQVGRLREHPQCVVGSIGRLTDFLDNEKHWFGVRSVRYLILDEADLLLGEGLSMQIRNITTEVETPLRQTMMFSATFDVDVRTLAAWILKRPIEVRVGMRDPLRANKDVAQQVLIVKDEADKQGALKNLLRKHYSPGAKDPGKILVFVNEADECDKLAKKIKSNFQEGGIDTLHANRKQEDRERAMANFRSGECAVLIATNVAGRGLDIKDVKVVVNFDPPEDALDYVHRIGRTGRAGRKGLAITLLKKGPDGRAMAYIAQVMRRTGLQVPRDLIDCLKQRRGRDMEFARTLLEGLCFFAESIGQYDRTTRPSGGTS